MYRQMPCGKLHCMNIIAFTAKSVSYWLPNLSCSIRGMQQVFQQVHV